MKRLLVSCFILWASFAPAADVSSPRHSVMGVQKDTLAVFDETGQLTWTYPRTPDAPVPQELPHGHILTQTSWTNVIELNRAGEIVWSYDSPKENGSAGRKIEVHAALRLDKGLTIIAECGAGRIIEVDRDGKLVHVANLQLDNPDAHRDTCGVLVLADGHSLVAHEGDGKIRGYARDGTVVWSDALSRQNRPRVGGHDPEGWGNLVNNAIRLHNGNTLIVTGSQHFRLKVNPVGEIVPSLLPGDLPGIVFAMTKQLEELPHENFIIGNADGSADHPQLIEVTREKEIVWSFRDFETLGNPTSTICTLGRLEEVIR
jgi:hypothetical protein